MAGEVARREFQRPWRVAAYLDSQGFGPGKIAEIVGCSRQTVQVWRKDPEYLTLRTEFEERERVELEPLVRRAKSEVADLLLSGVVPHLRDALCAVYDGEPAWQVRNKAAEISANLIVRSGVLGNPDGAPGGHASAQSVVAVYFPERGEQPPQYAQVIEIGEEEIDDHGHRQGAGEDQG